MLKSKRLIAMLFERGIRLKKYPFNLILLPVDEDGRPAPCRLLISVSSRKFRKAVERNRIKRLIRESYRRSKEKFFPYLTQNNKKCLLAIMYNGTEIPTFEQVNKILASLLESIPQVYEKYRE